MKLITKPQFIKLLNNGSSQDNDKPVVKLFMPDAPCTWLLTSIDPENTDIAYGIGDLGVGFPEFGPVSLAELTQLRGALGLPIERDRHFKPSKTTKQYLQEAEREGRLIA